MNRIPALCLLSITFLLTNFVAHAQSIILDKDTQPVFEEFNWMPYGFFSESFGLGIGVGAGYSGWPQEQASLLGAVTLGTTGSYNVTGGMSDYMVPGLERLVIEPFFSFGRYQEQRLYVGRNPDFGGERAGSNDSDKDHFVEATQWDNRAELDFRFLLPLGDGAETIVSRYVLDEGLLQSGASGGEAWNPLESGRTTLSLKPNWREQTLENDEAEVPLQSVAVEASLEYDNYDFPFNPSRGSFQRLSYEKDFDDDPNFGEWETWSMELSKVFDLGATESAHQRVLALSFWTAYVPTWETETRDGVEVITRRPPQFEGAVLGGLNRMRAYENERFHDKSAIYYSAELRMMPTWQPLKAIGWLDWADISWWQWVVFAEVGQVAPHYSFDDLHDDLHADGGISIRAMIHDAVCRLDFAAGEEGARVVAMYLHPF